MLDRVDDALGWVLDVVASVDPILRMVIAGVAMLLELSVVIGLIVPGDTIVIVAAMGVTSVWEGVLLAAAAALGSLAGETIGFGIGRWLGPHIRTSWVGRRIGEKNWDRAERYVGRRGGLAIFLARFLPVLRQIVPLTVGMSPYSFRRFVLWAAPSCVLWAALYVGIAATAAGSYRELAGEAQGAVFVLVGGLVLLVLVVLVIEKLISRFEKRHLGD